MAEKPSLVFFGTHEFGAAMLTALISSGLFSITTVVTQPDRVAGRGNEIQESQVKKVAREHGIRVQQPETLKKEISTFSVTEAELFVVCQYGLIIPQWVLDIPTHGTINVHTSLLPHYRGASPIQTALINGETETGVTIMLMDAKMDHGAILSQATIAIDPDETYPELSKKMEPIAADLLVGTLPLWLTGSITPEIQDESEVTLCRMFTRDDGKINFSRSAIDIYNQYRGLTPWPGIWTMWNNKRLKLISIKSAEIKNAPGTISQHEGRLYAGTAEGSIELITLQLEGKKAMSAREFLNGYPDFIEATLT
jgi:methionyl-tRNA formyltransferase